VSAITSRANPKVRRWRALALEAGERRREGRVIVEGPHLVAACLDAGHAVDALVLSESGMRKRELALLVKRAALDPVVLADPVFALVADAESPAGIFAEIRRPAVTAASARGAVFLDGVQDAGNVGAILRSAAAFGLGCAVLSRGCADAWSPKVLRAAMGAHFLLRIEPDADLEEVISSYKGMVACTVPRGGVPLDTADLTRDMGWLFGSEGQGLTAELLEKIGLKVSIPMAEGAESLNVAAAAAICFYAGTRGI
jgi:RNA methyltransferase, TrmH family